MVEWIRANKPAKLEGLWKAVLPEGSTAPPAEFAADLFWLLHQGHILLFTDDTLVVQEVRENQAPDSDAKAGKKKKKKSKKANPEGDATPDDAVSEDIEVADTDSDDRAVEIAADVTTEETPVVETEETPTEETPAIDSGTVEEILPEAAVKLSAEEETPAVDAASEHSPEQASSPESEFIPANDEELSKNPSLGVDVAPGL